jgi:hypothetical protein
MTTNPAAAAATNTTLSPGVPLFKRIWSINIGTLQISNRESITGGELTVDFEIKKSLESEPNKMKLKIANLSATTRQQIETSENEIVEVIAGYPGASDLIFAGDIRYATSTRVGNTIWTELEADDGGLSFRHATIRRSFEAGTSVELVFRTLVEALGVNRGNSSNVLSGIQATVGRARVTHFANGYVLNGYAQREMDRLARSCGLRWSIQNGAIQLRTAGRPIAAETAVRLTADTGLIGVPTRGSRNERTGRYSYGCKSLLQPTIYPGRVISLESQFISGNFLCTAVTFKGITTGEAWFCEIEMEEY